MGNLAKRESFARQGVHVPQRVAYVWFLFCLVPPRRVPSSRRPRGTQTCLRKDRFARDVWLRKRECNLATNAIVVLPVLKACHRDTRPHTHTCLPCNASQQLNTYVSVCGVCLHVCVRARKYRRTCNQSLSASNAFLFELLIDVCKLKVPDVKGQSEDKGRAEMCRLTLSDPQTYYSI